jgi:hypothetical protein
MMKLYEFTDDISIEQRMERMEAYLDEMILLTDELIQQKDENVAVTEYRTQNINTI